MQPTFSVDSDPYETESTQDTRRWCRWPVWVATLGAVGRIRFAPGTWGSLSAAIVGYGLFFPFSVWLRLGILIALFFFGAWCAERAEKQFGRKDPREVVVDEVLGQWIAFLPVGWPSTTDVFVGFVLFRFFDILKPPPIRMSETWLPGGYGVMIDDALAGVYAGVGLWCWQLTL
ncbi:phosphatidylglycerophosphatase A family protein [Desulfovibrio inopinatus]|uniref:phosphatidylglycerophosphatase A family protein n=1 Tax=Desulfovibrio inopinatus TaxID=102109 RepID=UPI00040C01F4|nr:phosphatidylglycerophosphatase A [Desulfovibrio inopinatus]